MTTVRTAEKVNVKVMNQSQYDSAEKDPTNLYVITDAQLSYNDLTDKLNFIEGSNIDITTSGSNITISATGSAGGGTWGSITGNIVDQEDLLPTIENVNSLMTSMAPTGEKETATIPPSSSDLATTYSGLSSGVIVTDKHKAEYTGLIKSVSVAEGAVASTPYTTTVYVFDLDIENSSYTLISQSTVTMSGTTNLLDTPLFIKKGQYAGFAYPGGKPFGYLSTGATSAYKTRMWIGLNAVKSTDVVSSISNPTTGYKLNWSFDYEYTDIYDIKEMTEEISDLYNKSEENHAVATQLSPLLIDEGEQRSETIADGAVVDNGKWWLVGAQTPGEAGGWLKGLYSRIEFTAEDARFFEVAKCKIDTETNKLTITGRYPETNVDFHTGTRIDFDKRIWVDPDEYILIFCGSAVTGTKVAYSQIGGAWILDTAYANLPQVGGSLTCKTQPWGKLTLSVGLIFDVAGAPNLDETITGLQTQIDSKANQEDFAPIDDMLTKILTEEYPGRSAATTQNLKGTRNANWLLRDITAQHTGYVSAIKFKLSAGTSGESSQYFSIASLHIEYDEESGEPLETGTYTVHDRKVDVEIPPFEAGQTYLTVSLPDPLYAEAGDYFVIGGIDTTIDHCPALAYTSPGTATYMTSCLNRYNGILTGASTSGKFNGWVDKWDIAGFSILLDWKHYKEIDAEFAIRDARLDGHDEEIAGIKSDLTWTTPEETVSPKAWTSAGSICGPNDIYWIDKHDIAPFTGKICKIVVSGNTATADTRCAIARFSISGEPGTDSATILDVKHFIMPAGATEYVFPKPEMFDVNQGDTIGICFPGQIRHGASPAAANNIINGGNVNSAVGATLTSHYNNNLAIGVRFYITTTEGVQKKVEDIDNDIATLYEYTEEMQTETSYKDISSVMLVGSSLTEAGYTPTYTTWPERLQDAVDINIYNNGLSGANIYSNLSRLSKNGDIRFAPGTLNGTSTCKAFDLHPTYFLWNDCANSSPYGKIAIQLYKKVKDLVESYGSKLLMGSEENYAGAYNAYEHTQQSFAEEAKIPYSPITRIQQMCYPRNNTAVCPYPVNGASHAGYRANSPYQVHRDLINALPIYKNVKMYRPRTTYKAGNPTIDDLVYDNIEQRLKYWTAIHPGQGGGNLPGHLDNLDNKDYDVPDTTHINPYGSRTEPADLFLGSYLSFDKWALTEIITERTGVTKGTFEITSNVEPTAVYIANVTEITLVGANGGTTYYPGQFIVYGGTTQKIWKVLREFTAEQGFPTPDPADAELIDFDNYIRTQFESLPFTYTNSKVTASFDDTTSSKHYQLYDKLRFVVYYSGGTFSLSKPRFCDYNGEKKLFDETIPYHRRKFGEEMLTVVNPSESGWTKSSGAETKTLPSEIANYTLYNNVLSHAQLNTEGSSVSRTETISTPAYRKVAVRLVSQIFSKIATTRFDGTELENTEYITNDKTDPLGLASYVLSDYDYGMLRVKINDNIVKNILVYPGWCESYFEADLTPDDTNLRISVEKISYVDDSYNNDDKPIFIHHISVQDITNQ